MADGHFNCDRTTLLIRPLTPSQEDSIYYKLYIDMLAQ
jgi:hypothetical protein